MTTAELAGAVEFRAAMAELAAAPVSRGRAAQSRVTSKTRPTGGTAGAPGGRRDPLTDLGPLSTLAWHDFRRHWTLTGGSKRTYDGYGDCLAQFSRWLAEDPTRPGEVLEATTRDAGDFLIHLRESGYSVGTCNNRLRSLRAWFGWALDNGITTANPFAGQPVMKGHQKIPGILDTAALNAMAEYARRTGRKARPGSYSELESARDETIIRLFCEFGSPRLAEMAGICVADADLGRDTVLVTGKGEKDRIIHLSPATAAALSRYLRCRARWMAAKRLTEKQVGHRLWLGKRGALHARSIALMLQRVGEAAGAGHVHPHMLRHTAWHRAELAGATASEGMAAFGWSQDTMTKLYGASGRDIRAAERARALRLGDL